MKRRPAGMERTGAEYHRVLFAYLSVFLQTRVLYFSFVFDTCVRSGGRSTVFTVLKGGYGSKAGYFCIKTRRDTIVVLYF